MRPILAATTLLLAAAFTVAEDKRNVTYVDLQPKGNEKLAEDFHGSDGSGNNLAALPKGEQTFAGVKFKVGEQAIQLGSLAVADKPAKVEGIKVGQKLAKLHILHATGHTVDDDTEIGSYTVHYADGSKETIPIVYGKDVRDWWYGDGAPDVSRGKVAWKGDNDAAKGMGARVRLYLTTWDNPHPDKQVTTIDYSAPGTTNAAPFCVAMTTEAK